MMNDYITYDEVEVYTSEIAEISDEITEVPAPTSAPTSAPTAAPMVQQTDVYDEIVANDYSDIISAINPDMVQDEVFRDSPMLYAAEDIELPDYVVTFDVDGVPVYFPTSYSEDLVLVDGMLVNLSDTYTVGVKLDSATVSNYLSSEVTIPTYHSSTWYQYLQNYGQPYRVVDRYVSNYGSISSTTRDSVNLTFSGGNSFSGFTFSKISIVVVIVLLVLLFVFRRGKS